MTHETRSTLNQLIGLLLDGAAFYADAAQKVEAPVYHELFLRMAHIKRAIAAELALHVASRDNTTATSTVLSRWQQTYADKRVGIGRTAEKIYLTLLAETEDRILDGFRQHVQDSDSAIVRSILSRALPDVQSAHDDMLHLKLRLAAQPGQRFPSLSAQASPVCA